MTISDAREALRGAIVRERERKAALGVSFGQPMGYGSGGYEGARKNRTATQQWTTVPGGANAALLPDLPTLRERSRHATQ